MNDFELALTGEWRFERSVTDGHRMSGSAAFEPRPDGGLHYREDGLLLLADRPGAPLRFSRSYLYRFAGPRLTILFDEAPPRLFETIALIGDASDWRGEGYHPCGADHYRSRYGFRADGFHTVHDVEGPRKAYAIETRYRRV